jgi:glucose-1-phosphate adenylyltransferase
MIQAKKKEMIAMLLAGGQGSRLGILTKDVPKPAVPFGGKYRIIDFPLSNCINSGIDTIGVLTQYQPLELHAYIGNGQPWDLDRINGGVSILPPYVKGKEGEWYKGTANAIYQNMNFIEMSHPEYVLILSGDHVYKMNYALMLDFHKANDADCTIAVLKVPIEEASRFGVMNAKDDCRIFEFEEKPLVPKSDLASMGVYIFTWEKLKHYLIEDENNCDSDKDFGKNVIPAMLAAGERMFAYTYGGYWKDVGTIESLWEANMDILDPAVPLHLNDPPWRIYSRNAGYPPHYIGKEAELKNCTVSEGCLIYGNISHSIVFPAVTIGRGAKISDSIIMPNAVIGEDAVIEYAIIGENASIDARSSIGCVRPDKPESEARRITVIGQNVRVGTACCIPEGEMIESDACLEVKP